MEHLVGLGLRLTKVFHVNAKLAQTHHYCLVETRVREQVKVNRVRNLGLQISISALKQTRQELADFIPNMLFMAGEGLVLVH